MALKKEDKSRIQDFYRKKLKKHGDNSAWSVDWESYENQQSRFDIFSKIGDLNGKSILDFGSGLGDWYGYLSKHFKGFDYIGIDIVPEMVEAAKKKYPNAKFVNAEIDAIDQSFDYVFASGSLTFEVEDGQNFYFKIIEKMYRLAKIGVGFNMLSKEYFGTQKLYTTYEPFEVVEFCKTFAKDIRVIVDYLEGEFTVYLFKKKQKA